MLTCRRSCCPRAHTSLAGAVSCEIMAKELSPVTLRWQTYPKTCCLARKGYCAESAMLMLKFERKVENV